MLFYMKWKVFALTDKIFSEEKLWTPANVVTLLRICLVPLFVVALLSPWPTWLFPDYPDLLSWKEWIAAGIFIVLAASDALDGYLARSRDEITNFGKFMDPLADKILVAAALLALIELNVLPSWVALVILCREFIVSGLRMVAATRGVVIAASWYGKAKTVSQIIAIVLFIIKDNHMVADFSVVLSDRLYMISWAVMIFALILTVISMLDYFAKAKTVLGFRGGEGNEALSSVDFASQVSQPNDKAGLTSSLKEAAQGVLKLAKEQDIKLATAESCTGGLIAASLTLIPGSSEVVEGGIVSYSNDVKHQSLKVSSRMLENYGAVSEEVAIAMAQGARTELRADIAVSVTGIAGPDGGSSEKPVGTVWIGLADARIAFARLYHFEGDRGTIRELTALEALKCLKAHMNQ